MRWEVDEPMSTPTVTSSTLSKPQVRGRFGKDGGGGRRADVDPHRDQLDVVEAPGEGQLVVSQLLAAAVPITVVIRKVDVVQLEVIVVAVARQPEGVGLPHQRAPTR